jgi:hypothetical protein
MSTEPGENCYTPGREVSVQDHLSDYPVYQDLSNEDETA